jgi:hypothetical protein
MRPARILTAVLFAAAVAVAGCAAHPTATPPAAPVTPAVAPTPPVPVPEPPVLYPKPPTPPTPPVLADGHYDSYIRTVDRSHNRLVVDLVQVFHEQAAIDAAIADGMPHDQAQVLYVYVRNHNPRLRTLPMARDLRLDLLPGDCIESRNHQFAKLVKDSRAMSGSRPAYYFTLTVAGGLVHRIQEDKTFNAC